MSQNLLEINNVTKIIKRKEVLKNINLSLTKGLIYGFVGHNGSGKTMLLRLILGLIHSNPPVNYHEKEVRFGAIIENPGFILELSGFRNLEILSNIRGLISKNEIMEAIKSVNLDPKSKKTVKTYSLGMRQKLAIAQAIMEKPDVLILDEPMNGLDRDSVIKIRELLNNLNSQGMTILIASHDSQDIEILCHEYFELENGSISKRVINKNKEHVPYVKQMMVKPGINDRNRS